MATSASMNNFLTGFGFTCAPKEASTDEKGFNNFMNAMKGVSYIPVLGTIAVIGVGILMGCAKGKDSPSKGQVFAVISRGLLSPVAPLTLLPLDLIGSIISLVKCCQKNPKALGAEA